MTEFWAFQFWRALTWLLATILASRFALWGLDIDVRDGPLAGLAAAAVQLSVAWMLASWVGFV